MMAATPKEALKEMFVYIAPVYGKSVKLRAYAPEYWKGFDQAIKLGYIEETDNIVPYQRTFRLVRKGYDYAVEVGLILTPPGKD